MPSPDVTQATAGIAFGTPFAEQVAFLRQKLRLPTERWDDIQQRAHDKAFIVAGAQRADLLNDLHQSIIGYAESGKGLAAFQRDFKKIVAKNGWTGWTGEGTPEGVAWRSAVIYNNNMSASYAAGRWQQLNDPVMKAALPYWRYIHGDNVAHPRPQHLAWHGLTLPNDHPFWRTHFAPNGWGCGCRITAVTKREGERSAKVGLGEPPDGWDTTDPKTGAPLGIDKGFDYAPGANVKTPLQKIIDDKLLNLDAPIGARMWESLKPALQEERLVQWQALFDVTRSTMKATGAAMQVHTLGTGLLESLGEKGIYPDNAAVWIRDKELLHAVRDTKSQRGAAIPDNVWRNLPSELENANAYLDTKNNTVLYAIDLGSDLGKVVVRLSYNEKISLDGVREKLKSNFIQTGGIVEKANLQESRYVEL